MDPYQVLDRVVRRFKAILKENLVGIYLHGSLAMGCYSAHSDIDFLAVVGYPLNYKTKRLLVDELLKLQDCPKRVLK